MARSAGAGGFAGQWRDVEPRRPCGYPDLVRYPPVPDQPLRTAGYADRHLGGATRIRPAFLTRVVLPVAVTGHPFGVVGEVRGGTARTARRRPRCAHSSNSGYGDVGVSLMVEGLPLAEELSAVYARMSGLLLSEETVGTAVRLVTALATEAIPGAVGAGVTLVDERGGKTTSGGFGPGGGEGRQRCSTSWTRGPCLTAWAQRALVRIDDDRVRRAVAAVVRGRWSRSDCGLR